MQPTPTTLFHRIKKILSFLLPMLLSYSQFSGARGPAVALNQDDVDEGYYIIDSPFVDVAGSSRGRFMATAVTSIVKKGAQCNLTDNICDGVWANKGKSRLHCCKKHCRNILGDRNNCSKCGHKCKFGQLCCSGTCTNIGFNSFHCGKCNYACDAGVKCEYGVCGYA